jgi:signal transduction histidine kinase
MKANVNRSIEFAKMGSNIALVPKLDTIDLVESLTGPLQVVRITHPAVSITLAPLPNEVCPLVITDKLWLSENALCLLSNAVNYSDGGAIFMKISLHTLPSLPISSASSTSQSLSIVSDSVDLRSPVHLHSAARPDISLDLGSSLPMLRVTVTDCGIGVSPDVRSKLFQPFQQAQRMAGGSGLGLFSLSKRIAALGGRCGVDSRADGAQGSSFWFEFPYRPYATDLADDASANEQGAPAVVSKSSGNKNDIARVDVELSALGAHPWAMRRRSMLLQSTRLETTINTTTLPLRILLGTFMPLPPRKNS